MNNLPLDSVRGIVRHWIELHAHLLGDDVLEVGSRMHKPDAWWINNRDLAKGQWTGIDMQPGLNVDVNTSIEDMPAEWNQRYSGVLCCEVLEHVRRPWVAIPRLRDVMQPGALLVITVPWCFPKHAFPEDYFRYTPQGISTLLEDAGFVDIITTQSRPELPFALNDHGEPGFIRITEPLHTYATARAP